MNLFQNAIRRTNDKRPPVWFMRQAGRYHSHYQELKKSHSFVELCKIPEVACEATLGPVRDFDFDAAILFSDLLFPLEVLGMGLTYEPGPKLSWHLNTREDLARFQGREVGGSALAGKLAFQAEAMRLIRKALPREKGLLGFVGGPLTLFCYAAEGSHSGELKSAREGLKDGRFAGFNERLIELLAENMALQARAGADTIAVMDTCGGEFSAEVFGAHAVPPLAKVLERFRKRCPETPVTYYSKGTGPEHWRFLENLPIECLGIDWRQDLAKTLTNYSSRWAIQGNVDPEWLFLEPRELETRLRDLFLRIRDLPARTRAGWICGLGHGVLQKTPENNVKLFLRVEREVFDVH